MPKGEWTRGGRFAILTMMVVGLSAGPVLATCGGGGGGGLGGAASLDAAGGPTAQIYRVPWTVVGPGQTLPAATPLTFYWFPTSADESRASGLQTSRALTMASARCVTMLLVTPDYQELYDRFQAKPGPSLVVLAGADGKEIGRVAASEGKLSISGAEKLVEGELGRLEKAAKATLDAAEKKAATDKDGAIADYQQVWRQSCLFPSLGKKAAKALKKLGVAVEQARLDALGVDGLPDPGAVTAADAENALLHGLEAELRGDYPTARQLYQSAVALDPADTVALRFLGELYRHHTGEWPLARQVFLQVLDRPADPISRAVALHGLGKMTIHAGRFGEGLALFESSLKVYPLPITYRNLAVYWFSEKQAAKAAGYVEQAIALAPNDAYNQIFSAVYLAVAGKKEAAIAAAKASESVLEASYNLAAIWAQLGDKAKAMALLERHFYQYERYDAVRAMEMQEARDDFMFAGLHADPDFVALTGLASRHHELMMGQ